MPRLASHSLRLAAVAIVIIDMVSPVVAYAQNPPVSLTLTPPTYCTLAPLAGQNQCSDTGNADNNNDTGWGVLTWTYDSNHLTVCVTGTGGSPLSSPCDIYQGYKVYTDIGFTFVMTYIKSTCDAGTYNVVFALSKGSYTAYATFSVYVKCVLSPTA